MSFTTTLAVADDGSCVCGCCIEKQHSKPNVSTNIFLLLHQSDSCAGRDVLCALLKPAQAAILV